MKRLSMSILVLAMVTATAAAYNVQSADLTTFTAGSPARASEVNGNFTVLQGAINDNDSRISTLEANPTYNSVSGMALLTSPAGLTGAGVNILSAQIIAPADGAVIAFASGFGQYNTSGVWLGAQYWLDTSSTAFTVNQTRTRVYLPTTVTGGFELPFSATGWFPVSAGQTITVYLKGKLDNTPGATVYAASLVTLFSPN